MSKIAFMFPGQGAQYTGMAKDFYEQVPASRKIFEQASNAVGFSMEELCFEENDRLNITEYTQAAMLTASAAILEAVKESGISSCVNAGLSLGEYGALLASEVLSFQDAVKIVRQRGILMQEEVPVGQGAMAAVFNLDAETIRKVCEETQGIVTVANYNCPGQIVISGETDAVERAGVALKEAGARRIVPLKVSGPFHSPMLRGAGEKLGEVLEQATFANPKVPYVANVDAQYVTDAAQIPALLKQQVSSSVMWQQSVENMLEQGVDTFIEIGPGKSLSAFVKKINRQVTVCNVEKIENLKDLKEKVALC
jgi:[acyl-carrier-protein] S-malonyltransferase